MKPLLRTLVFLSLLVCSGMSQAAETAPGREELKAALRDILHDDPNLILDVLRENSELVLDIAQQGSNQRRLKALSAQWRKELDTPRPMVLSDRPIRGAEDAPVTIVGFSDFTCPYCIQAAGTIAQMLREHEGTVRFVFKHYPLEGHRYARLAAEYQVAAGFQGQDRAWAMYDLLFRYGSEINEAGEALIKRAAEEAGLDMKKLNADLRNKASQIRTIIEEDVADAKALGLQGTPNFLVNNLVIRGALAPDLFGQAVAMALDHSRKR